MFNPDSGRACLLLEMLALTLAWTIALCIGCLARVQPPDLTGRGRPGDRGAAGSYLTSLSLPDRSSIMPISLRLTCSTV
jgi:hypothetical protein